MQVFITQPMTIYTPYHLMIWMIIIIVRDLQEITFQAHLNITLVMDETVNLKSRDPELISVTLLAPGHFLSN